MILGLHQRARVGPGWPPGRLPVADSKVRYTKSFDTYPKKRGIAVGTALLTKLMLFAADGGNAAPKEEGGNMFVMLLPWLAIGFLFYLLLIRPQRRKQEQQKTMLSALKKNDRVITAGGIHGVVANVNAEAGEVFLKVDEGTNTKLKVSLNSIAHVITDESSDEASK